jgi:tRNA A-37 threonylcarbamoyl transferase component Bud32
MWRSSRTEQKFSDSLYKRLDPANQPTLDTYRKGFKAITIKDRKVLLKEPPRDERDDFTNELRAGLAINSLRDDVPNFMWTYGLVTLKDRQRYIALEHIPGETIHSWIEDKPSFKKVFHVIVQVLLSIKVAYMKMGTSHYNLHTGNVILKKLDQPYLVNYTINGETYTVETKLMPVLIDFGRTYTHRTGGHTLKSDGIKPVPNHQFDIYVFLHSVLGKDYREELAEILSWFGVEVSVHYRRTIHSIELKDLSMKDFFRKAKKAFGYVPTKHDKVPKLNFAN